MPPLLRQRFGALSRAEPNNFSGAKPTGGKRINPHLRSATPPPLGGAASGSFLHPPMERDISVQETSAPKPLGTGVASRRAWKQGSADPATAVYGVSLGDKMTVAAISSPISPKKVMRYSGPSKGWIEVPAPEPQAEPMLHIRAGSPDVSSDAFSSCSSPFRSPTRSRSPLFGANGSPSSCSSPDVAAASTPEEHVRVFREQRAHDFIANFFNVRPARPRPAPPSRAPRAFLPDPFARSFLPDPLRDPFCSIPTPIAPRPPSPALRPSLGPDPFGRRRRTVLLAPALAPFPLVADEAAL